MTGDLEDAQVFTVPVQRTMVEHANSLAMLDALGVTSTIVGMSDALLQKAGGEWYDRVIADAGNPTNIGGDSNGEGFDYEAMLGLEADLMINGGYGSSYQYSRPQVEAGIPAVLGSNRIEATPLASAEWIKFFSAFYDAEAKANEIFDGIEQRYEETAARLEEADLEIEAAYLCMGREAGCEFMYAHGAKSLNGHLLDSLGVENPFAEGNDRPNGMTFDFEQSLDRAADADYFLVYSTPDAVAEALQDSRFQQFSALASGNFATRTGDKFDECSATTYLYVDGLARDYAIALAPDLFPGETGNCFEAWQG